MDKEDKSYSIFILHKMQDLCLEFKRTKQSSDFIYQIESYVNTLLEIIENVENDI